MLTKTDETTKNLFNSIDRMDNEAFLDFLTDDVIFRFGNASAVTGKTATGAAVSGFFSSIKGIQHELISTWVEEGATICHGTVTYTRHDTTTLSIPFANILILENDLIKDYMIFADTSQLYES